MLMLADMAWRRAAARGPALGLVTLLAALATVAYHVGASPPDGTGLFIQDRWTACTALLVLFSALCILLMSWRDVAGGEYTLLLVLATLGATAMVFSANDIPFFLGLEIVGMSLPGLLAFRRHQIMPACEAAMKYLILSGLSSAVLLFGMGLAYATTGSLRFVLPAPVAGTPPAMAMAATVMILAGMFFKLSAVPFHMWLPDVMEGAPVPVAAFIAVVSKIAMFSVFVRYFGAGPVTPTLNGVLYAVIILTILGGNLLALRQTSLMRLMACSSIAHVGYLLIAFFCPGSLQAGAITVYLLAYTVSTLGVFAIMSASAVPADPGGTVIAEWKGLFSRRPFLATAMSLMLLSLAGIPPGIGFLAKFQIAATGVEHQRDLLLCVLVIGSIIGLYYYLNIIRVMMGTATLSPLTMDRRMQPELTALIIVLSMIVVIGGLFPARIIQPLLPVSPGGSILPTE